MTAMQPKCQRDGDRYIVLLGGDRIGFVERYTSRSITGRRVFLWNAVDTTMAESRGFTTRADAVARLSSLAATAATTEGRRP